MMDLNRWYSGVKHNHTRGLNRQTSLKKRKKEKKQEEGGVIKAAREQNKRP
jgi:hypothetical protein